jgi:signal transduction histidine kinase
VTLAPLAGLPLLAEAQFGDGGLLLCLAALFAVLMLVVEARNLATARSEAEVQRDRLTRANELQSDLFHLVTHELKNPLTAVLVYTQLAERALREAATDRLPTHVGGIERAAKGMQRLIDNLLQLSRLEESGGDVVAPEAVDLEALSMQVVGDLQALADQRHLTLQLDLPPALPSLWTSPLLLSEALSNLVSNAIKYTPEGGEVRVWAQHREPQQDIVVGVSDTGIGLSSEDLERVFTRFFRSADPRARLERGSGLGLALTRAIISRIGGRIEVDSKLNSGTTFRIALPHKPR